MIDRRIGCPGRLATTLAALAAWGVVSLLVPGGAAAEPSPRQVNCDEGKTIAEALEQAGDHELVIVVNGTCQENVVIARGRVTLLAGHSGAGVNGPNLQASTILVRGAHVTIDGLTVTGGASGIVGIGTSQLAIRNCAVTAGRNGIVFADGASGSVDACAAQGNGRDGVQIGDNSTAAVTNSTITGNARHGILVFSGGHARIGLTLVQALAGNTISGNRSAGVQVTNGSSATIGGNTISGNGFLPNGSAGQLPFGVNVFHSQATLGNNTITGNAGSGVIAGASRVVIGTLVGAPAPQVNTISGNGSVGFPNAQVFATGGASIEVRDAQISGDRPGVALQLRSVMNTFGSSISNSAGNAVEIGTGAGVSFATPTVTLTATGFGLECFGQEASFVGVPAGTISPNCTGF